MWILSFNQTRNSQENDKKISDQLDKMQREFETFVNDCKIEIEQTLDQYKKNMKESQNTGS